MSWTGNLEITVTIKKKIYKVLIYDMRVIDFLRDFGEKNAQYIKNENKRLYWGLKVIKTVWTHNIEDSRDYASLIMKVNNTEYANNMIDNGILYNYDFKIIKLYNLKCRVL